ncbi:hypothetical protein AAIH70_30205 [Neorhizobium sp. BT27B]|uniref:hypothetical protein n=1 Tax=Neorhizobium sp. BT27B TaxID=3142625 RepID=UPI003D273764
MTNEWQADLKLKVEDLVDKFVVQGMAHEEVLKAVSDQLDRLRSARQKDPDPADDASVIDEPANDWHAAN